MHGSNAARAVGSLGQGYDDDEGISGFSILDKWLCLRICKKIMIDSE